MTNEKGQLLNRTNLLLFGIASLFFTYVVLRAIIISFSFDEIASSWIMNDPNWYNLSETANNHFLNTLLMKISTGIFGTSEFAYRLPNVLAYSIYLFYSIKLGSLLKVKHGQFISLILLSSMPFLLDFFSLARGYGLSLGLLLPSIYYFFKFCDDYKTKFAVFAILFSTLGVLSNFTVLNFYLSLVAILFLFILISSIHFKEKFKKISILTFLVVPFVLYTVILLFQLKEANQLYFGGRDSFLSDTINSLGRCFGYYTLKRGFAVEVFRVLFFLTLAIAVTNVILSLRNKKATYQTAIGLVFISCILAPILQHALFETNYPVERTALLYYPIMILVLIFGIIQLKSKFAFYFLSVISIGFFAQFVNSLNLTHTYSWRYDSASKQVIQTIFQREKGNKTVRLGFDYLLNPSVEFYKQYYNFGKLRAERISEIAEYHLNLEELDLYYYGVSVPSKLELDEEGLERILNSNYDYLYLDEFYIKELKMLRIPFETIEEYPYSRTTLITLRK